MSEAINPQEALETILYKFLSLHDAMDKQRVTLEHQNEDLTVLIQAFTEEIQKYQQFDTAIRQQIAMSIQVATKSLGHHLGEEAQKTMTVAISDIAYQLHHAADKTQQTLQKAQERAQDAVWKRLLGTVLCAVFASVASVWLLMPTPTLPLTQDQLKLYQLGQDFSRQMNKLSEHEQKTILDKLQGKKTAKPKSQQG